MRPIPLNDNLQDIRTGAENRSEEAAIHAEIAVRILELKAIVGGNRVIWFFEKSMAIFNCQFSAYWTLLNLMTGDLSAITRSYTDIGKDQARTKQATQQELERDLEIIGRHFPMLKGAIIELRTITAKVGQEPPTKPPVI